jgi:hypothetical protein
MHELREEIRSLLIELKKENLDIKYIEYLETEIYKRLINFKKRRF